MTPPLPKPAQATLSDHRGVHRPVASRKVDFEVTSVLERSFGIPKLSVRDVSLSYATNSNNRLIALKNINLQVQPGEFLCIVGPSGCGKSTLLHLIAGLHQQSSGDVLVDNTPVQGPGTDRILIFQELGLFPWLTVAQNVEFGMRMKGVSKSER